MQCKRSSTHNSQSSSNVGQPKWIQYYATLGRWLAYVVGVLQNTGRTQIEMRFLRGTSSRFPYWMRTGPYVAPVCHTTHPIWPHALWPVMCIIRVWTESGSCSNACANKSGRGLAQMLRLSPLTNNRCAVELGLGIVRALLRDSRWINKTTIINTQTRNTPPMLYGSLNAKARSEDRFGRCANKPPTRMLSFHSLWRAHFKLVF